MMQWAANIKHEGTSERKYVTFQHQSKNCVSVKWKRNFEMKMQLLNANEEEKEGEGGFIGSDFSYL